MKTSVEKLRKDWYESELMQEIIVADGSLCPETHPEELLYRPYYGSYEPSFDSYGFCMCDDDEVMQQRE